jgi:hypothetical protein
MAYLGRFSFNSLYTREIKLCHWPAVPLSIDTHPNCLNQHLFRLNLARHYIILFAFARRSGGWWRLDTERWLNSWDNSCRAVSSPEISLVWVWIEELCICALRDSAIMKAQSLLFKVFEHIRGGIRPCLHLWAWSATLFNKVKPRI